MPGHGQAMAKPWPGHGQAIAMAKAMAMAMWKVEKSWNSKKFKNSQNEILYSGES